MKILPVILSGGFGTRLWPLSRQASPKQFLNELFASETSDETLFAKALKLVGNSDLFLPSLAITNCEHKFHVLKTYQSLNLSPSAVILEPCSKNTAIAILMACLAAIKIFGDQKIKLLILPSDHLISPQNLFEESVINALEVAQNCLVTFGVRPHFAATGYGYIKRGNNISDHCFNVEKFIEKPALQQAEEFLQQNNYCNKTPIEPGFSYGILGEAKASSTIYQNIHEQRSQASTPKLPKKTAQEGFYFWNAGIFLIQSNIYLAETTKYLPEQVEIAKNSLANAKQDGILYEINFADYEKAQNISIDYAILEKSANIATTELKANWSDVGDFGALYEIAKKDRDNNAKQGDVEFYDSKNCFVKSDNKLIACLGLENIVAIETDDAILIADKNKIQDVKLIAADLLAKNKNEVKFHNRVFRPWGYYETISQDQNFKVKRILVNPNSSLSLQMHNHRSEHWVVIKGVATVQKDEEIFDLEAGKSTFIPIKTKHRLSNNGAEDLEIIEVQMGEKVEEEDIVRFEDNYGRK